MIRNRQSIFRICSIYWYKLRLPIEIPLLAGPDHMTMYIVPHAGMELVDWSIDRGHPTPVSKRKDSNETLYFVYYSHGVKPDSPWEFYLDFKVPLLKSVKLVIFYRKTITRGPCATLLTWETFPSNKQSSVKLWLYKQVGLKSLLALLGQWSR